MPRHRTLSIRTRGSATKIAPKGTPTMTKVTLALAQINPLVGDIPGNTQKVLAQARYAQEQLGASAIVFPELVLSGYPPEDLLLRPSMGLRVERALEELKAANLNITLILGYPRVINGSMFNIAGVIRGSTLVCEYAKQCLPNVQVFDEVRYFTPGDRAAVFDLGEFLPRSVCVRTFGIAVRWRRPERRVRG